MNEAVKEQLTAVTGAIQEVVDTENAQNDKLTALLQGEADEDKKLDDLSADIQKVLDNEASGADQQETVDALKGIVTNLNGIRDSSKAQTDKLQGISDSATSNASKLQAAIDKTTAAISSTPTTGTDTGNQGSGDQGAGDQGNTNG